MCCGPINQKCCLVWISLRQHSESEEPISTVEHFGGNVIVWSWTRNGSSSLIDVQMYPMCQGVAQKEEIDWPSQCHDLKPIEMLVDLKRAVYTRKPKNIFQLKIILHGAVKKIFMQIMSLLASVMTFILYLCTLYSMYILCTSSYCMVFYFLWEVAVVLSCIAF